MTPGRPCGPRSLKWVERGCVVRVYGGESLPDRNTMSSMNMKRLTEYEGTKKTATHARRAATKERTAPQKGISRTRLLLPFSAFLTITESSEFPQSFIHQLGGL